MIGVTEARLIPATYQARWGDPHGSR